MCWRSCLIKELQFHYNEDDNVNSIGEDTKHDRAFLLTPRHEIVKFRTWSYKYMYVTKFPSYLHHLELISIDYALLRTKKEEAKQSGNVGLLDSRLASLTYKTRVEIIEYIKIRKDFRTLTLTLTID